VCLSLDFEMAGSGWTKACSLNMPGSCINICFYQLDWLAESCMGLIHVLTELWRG
jgi:hypothetical protein